MSSRTLRTLPQKELVVNVESDLVIMLEQADDGGWLNYDPAWMSMVDRYFGHFVMLRRECGLPDLGAAVSPPTKKCSHRHHEPNCRDCMFCEKACGYYRGHDAISKWQITERGVCK